MGCNRKSVQSLNVLRTVVTVVVHQYGIMPHHSHPKERHQYVKEIKQAIKENKNHEVDEHY